MQFATSGPLEMSKLLTALPPGVVRELCQYLNVEGSGVRNWEDLITKVKGTIDSLTLVSSH